MSEWQVAAETRPEVEELLAQHGRAGSAAAVVYYSFRGPQSFIGARDPDGRISPLIGFLPLPVRGTELLAAIAEIDENSPALIANYESAFPAAIRDIHAVGAEFDSLRSESLGWLLAASSLVLGMQEEDLAMALGEIPSLVMVDTVVDEYEERYVLDGRSLLRSLMSYRIAEVPSYVLMRSVFESLGAFAATAVRRLLRDWKVDVVVCAGDLFARNKFIADRARRGLVSPRLTLCFPPSAEAPVAEVA